MTPTIIPRPQSALLSAAEKQWGKSAIRLAQILHEQRADTRTVEFVADNGHRVDIVDRHGHLARYLCRIGVQIRILVLLLLQ